MKTRFILLIALVAFLASGCSVTTKTLKSPNSHVEFQKEDFTFSEQVTAEASQTVILGIDFARLFSQKYGDISNPNEINIPIVGNILAGDPEVNRYALYNLMQDNPGYDVVFYPQFETSQTRPIGIPMIFEINKTKVKARLGKVKK